MRLHDTGSDCWKLTGPDQTGSQKTEKADELETRSGTDSASRHASYSQLSRSLKQRSIGRQAMTRMIGIGLMVGLAATVGGSVLAAQTARDAQRLVDAVKVQDVEAVQALVKAGTDVNLRQGDGTAALHWAAHRDDAAVADLLIRAGATPNLADDHGVTRCRSPVSMAARRWSAVAGRWGRPEHGPHVR